jgi:hypothetical protein
LTFKPQLNPTSEALVAEMGNRGDIVERLYSKQREYEFKVWLRQQEKEAWALQGCTF